MKLTEQQVNLIIQYLAWVMKHLEMADWKISLALDEHPDNKDAAAEIRPIGGRKLATLLLCEDFLNDTVDNIRHYLIHECCHLLSRDVEAQPRLSLVHFMSQREYDVWWLQYTQAIEVMTDTMAYAFADLLPDDGGILSELVLTRGNQ